MSASRGDEVEIGAAFAGWPGTAAERSCLGSVRGRHDAVGEQATTWQRCWAPLEARLRSGEGGGLLARQLADEAKRLIEAVARAASVPWDGIALVAVGGFGRGELAPASDVDLLLLHGRRQRRAAEQLARQLVPQLWDLGLRVGISVRSVRECQRLARSDLTCLTNLLTARLLLGSERLFAGLEAQIKHWPASSWARAATERLAREVLQRPAYPPVHLLAPDLKEGAGGLRDLHRLQWIDALTRGTPLGVWYAAELLEEDRVALRQAHGLLWTLRWWVQCLTKRPTNRLDRELQLQIATLLGYRDTAHALGVEKLMRQLYRAMSEVCCIVRRIGALVADSRRQRVRVTASSGATLEVRRGLLATARTDSNTALDLPAQLEVLELAAREELELSASLLRVLLRSPLPAEAERLAARRALWARLEARPWLGRLLRLASDCGLLSRLLPDWEHGRGLVQFTEYHEYTVDEHSIVAVEEAVRLEQEASLVGEVYRRLPEKRLLHLALLIHDLGKGYREDHSRVGVDIARGVAHSFQLAPAEAELLRFLVAEHLLLSHTAFRRDVEDPATVAEVAQRVGTGERLDHLYVMTVCDIRAAGPQRLNPWKAALLENAYRRLHQLLADVPVEDDRARSLARQRQRALELAGERGERFRQWLASLPSSYLLGTEPELIVRDYAHLAALRRGMVEADIQGGHNGTWSVTVYAHDRPRLFADIVTGLYVAGTAVIEARVATLPDGTIVDRFLVSDLIEDNPSVRAERIRQGILRAVYASTDPEQLLDEAPLALRRRHVGVVLEADVKTDTTLSPEYTVIDVFFHDAPGTLYRLSRALYRLGLEIVYAKIARYGDRVVDVFYVVEQSGRPPRDPQRLRRIRHELLATLRGLQAARHA